MHTVSRFWGCTSSNLRLVFVSLLVMLACSALMFHSMSNTKSQAQTHVLAASYYSVKGNLSTTLTMNNKGPQPLAVQPTLFSTSGQRLDLPGVTVEGNSFQVIDLRDYSLVGTSLEEGSIQVLHEGHFLQLGAQIKMVDA